MRLRKKLVCELGNAPMQTKTKRWQPAKEDDYKRSWPERTCLEDGEEDNGPGKRRGNASMLAAVPAVLTQARADAAAAGTTGRAPWLCQSRTPGAVS